MRTFAQEISHVTTAKYYFASKILGEKMPVDPKSIESLTTKEELLKAAADSFAYAHRRLQRLQPRMLTLLLTVSTVCTRGRSSHLSFLLTDSTTIDRWSSICA